MADKLLEQYKHFTDNVKELSEKYPNKYIVIKDLNVIGSYDSFNVALKETVKTINQVLLLYNIVLVKLRHKNSIQE